MKALFELDTWLHVFITLGTSVTAFYFLHGGIRESDVHYLFGVFIGMLVTHMIRADD